MAKARKEGKKGKSRKSILKTLKRIENNDKLLQKYKEELDKLTITGCSACKKNALKSKYIKEVWENHITKTI